MDEELQGDRRYVVVAGPYRDIVVTVSRQGPLLAPDGRVLVEDARPGASHTFYVRPHELEPWGDGPAGVREPRRPDPRGPVAYDALPTPHDSSPVISRATDHQ